jgi:PIN domain nuclease of toxin-antitoxin system
MGLLIDTHAFLWWVEGSIRLSARARRAIGQPDEECYVSLARGLYACAFVILDE